MRFLASKFFGQATGYVVFDNVCIRVMPNIMYQASQQQCIDISLIKTRSKYVIVNQMTDCIMRSLKYAK